VLASFILYPIIEASFLRIRVQASHLFLPSTCDIVRMSEASLRQQSAVVKLINEGISNPLESMVSVVLIIPFYRYIGILVYMAP
jgi:hypothetical protein